MKVRYTGSMGCITPVGNADAFPGTLFGWFCPRPISLLARRNMPLSALLNAWLCEHLWCDLTLLLFAGERFSELPKDNWSSARVSILSGTMGSFPLL